MAPATIAAYRRYVTNAGTNANVSRLNQDLTELQSSCGSPPSG
jgi:hypothetical protein